MQKTFVWKGLSNDTEEHCSVNFLDSGIMVRSELEGWAEGKPVYLEYTIHLDSGWDVIGFDVNFHVSDHQHAYGFRKNTEGAWHDNSGKLYAGFTGCRYIDITLTPFTNSLPINGLHLHEGQSAGFDVLYIDIMENEVRKDRQQYTRMAGNIYRFENNEGRFSAVIDVDDDGFVTDYPGLFKMYRPR